MMQIEVQNVLLSAPRPRGKGSSIFPWLLNFELRACMKTLKNLVLEQPPVWRWVGASPLASRGRLILGF